MKLLHIIVLTMVALFSASCGIFGPGKELSTDYPASYPVVQQATIDSLIESFAEVNGEDVCIKFNKYGVIHYPGCLDRVYLKNITNSSRMNSMAIDFLLKNSDFTGISDTIDLVIKSEGLGGHEDTVHVIWGVSVRRQMIEGITVLRSDVVVYLNSNGVIGIGGAWYDNIIAPSFDKYSPSEAKDMIVGHKLTYSNFGRESELTITRTQIHREVEKFILPVRTDRELQLRVVWRITIGEVLKWYVYFDSITGEIVQTKQLFVT